MAIDNSVAAKIRRHVRERLALARYDAAEGRIDLDDFVWVLASLLWPRDRSWRRSCNRDRCRHEHETVCTSAAHDWFLADKNGCCVRCGQPVPRPSEDADA